MASTSRRGLLKAGIAAAGAAAAGVRPSAAAQSPSAAVVSGRRFKAWVSRGTGPARTTLEELTLRPIGGRQVLVRTEATNLCYSNTGAVLAMVSSPTFDATLGLRCTATRTTRRRTRHCGRETPSSRASPSK